MRKYYICACLILATATGVGRAGDDTGDLFKQIEQLKQQIQELKQRQDNATTPVSAEAPGPDGQPQLGEDAVRRIVKDYMKEQDAQKADAKKQKDADGYGVAEDLNMTTRWNPLIGRGLEFSTPAKDFIIHIGGRYYEDFVTFGQSDLSNPKHYTSNPGGTVPAPASFGTGNYVDGTFFRRLRLTVDGQLYENWEFFTEYQFEQVNTSGHGIVNLDEFWIGSKNIPIIQNARVGSVKLQQGFESLSSSRVITFLERSPLFDTFDVEFGYGLWLFQDFFDQHMTLHEQLLRKGQTDDGLQFGDGLWHYVARATILPLWEDQGRTMLHLGVSNQFAERNFFVADNPTIPENGYQNFGLEYRTRVSQRDAIGTPTPSPFGAGTVSGTDGNGTAVINTGVLNATGFNQLGGELFFVRGPWSVQSEYIVSFLHGFNNPSAGPYAQSAAYATTTHYTPAKDPVFWGYYVQTGYFLTGENRYYDRRTGRAPGTYASRILTPAWAVRDECGKWDFGRGAWEVAARFSHVQLDSQNVLGGDLNELTIGLNWFPIQNMKIQFQGIFDQRNNMFPVSPVAGLGNAAQPIYGDRGFSNWITGFGVRFGLDY
jgi:phosphate-selective porin OprO/OprP